MNSVGMQALAFRRVEVAYSHNNDGFSINFWIPPAGVSEVAMTYACQCCQYHPVNIAGWRCLIGVEIGVGVNPEDAYIFVYFSDAANRAKSDAMIAPQDEWKIVFLKRVCDNVRQLLTNLHDWFKIFYLGIA